MVKDEEGTDEGARADVEKVESRLKRVKFFQRLRLAITILIVLGLVVYLYAVYAAASSIEVVEERIESVSPTGNPEEYEAVLILTIDNPTSTEIEVDRLTYELYMEDEYMGEGEKSFFSIPQGTHDMEFQVVFEIGGLSNEIRNLFIQDTANLTIEGDITIPAKVFGLFTYTTITIPYSVTEEVSGEVEQQWDPPPPVVLSNPTPTSLDSALLTWTVSVAEDFDLYEVHMSTTEGFDPSNETVIETITEVNKTTHEVENLEPLEKYYFKIMVWTTHDLSSTSNEVAYPGA